MYSFEVVLPVCNPDKRVYMVIDRLLKQDAEPKKINIYLTVTDKFGEYELLKGLKDHDLSDQRITVTAIPASEFNHGGTRQKAAETIESDYCLFMTQDAMPVDKHLTSVMLGEFKKDRVAVCYARQLPYKDASLKERYARNYNYPPSSQIKDKTLLVQGKIKAIFCSDVCAMYDMKVFNELGGFETNVNFNEDMLYAYKALSNDYRISYAAKALVYHSHNLSLRQQYRRNKALAKSQKEHPVVFGNLSSESEGMVFVKNGL
ncbi:MAG: glycosyltransferase [Lachnospiraceae bacterium]|nr:glycosyltransferase [Lachnospiraceae bacterium]